MHTPAFTIITTTYNRADLLLRCMTSVVNQTFDDWEYIVIDDGSLDNTPEIVSRFIDDPRIIYIQKPNTGAAASRNEAVKHARGRMISFLDSDDEALPDWLAFTYRMADTDVGVISVGAYRCVEGGTETEELPYDIAMFKTVVNAKLTCGSLFFTKELYDGINGYDESIRSGLQTEFGIRLLIHACEKELKILSASNCLVKIHVHSGDRMRNNWSELVRDTNSMIEKLYGYYYANDKEQLSRNFTVLAYYNHKAHNRIAALTNMIKAIQLRPLRVSNYVRVVKYSF